MIFFDIDDTLLDYRTAQDTAAQKFAETVAADISPSEFITLWDSVTKKQMDKYLRGQLTFQEQRRARVRAFMSEDLSDQEADALFKIYLDAYEQAWAVFPDCIPALNQLKRYSLGIITNGDRASQIHKLNRLHIAEYFQHVVTPADCGVAKPSAAIFLHAAKQAGKMPSECWYVGDNLITDYHGAINSGFNAFWLNRYSAEGVCDHQCKSLLALAEVLGNFMAHG